MVESLVVDEWIYDTLTADATLQGLLAVDNRSPSYQQGIYLYFAPEKDPISLRQPQVPYIVVRHTDAGQTDTTSMCGGRIVTTSSHQVWWHRGPHRHTAQSADSVKHHATVLSKPLERKLINRREPGWPRRQWHIATVCRHNKSIEVSTCPVHYSLKMSP